jgi:hypothetical protein
MDALEAVGSAAGALRLGTIERIDDAGTPWVRSPRRKAVPCRVLEGIGSARLERARSEPSPVLVAPVGKAEGVILGVVAPAGATASVDGRKLVLTGEEEVVLRCGKASITLTSAGKVLLKGEYVSSKSAGVNRVKGAAVQIN